MEASGVSFLNSAFERKTKTKIQLQQRAQAHDQVVVIELLPVS